VTYISLDSALRATHVGGVARNQLKYACTISIINLVPLFDSRRCFRASSSPRRYSRNRSGEVIGGAGDRRRVGG
jgi:hypothetical protein